MDLRAAMAQGQKLLEDANTAAPRLTAEVLLSHAIGCDRAWLYAHSNDELREVWWIHYGRYLHQRLKGTPTQYITGKQEFYGWMFRVTPDVLIPRPETEHLIEAALERCRDARAIVDIGTGSGVIAVTLGLEMKARVLGTDMSAAALQVAAGNSRNLGADVSFVCCDLASALADQSFDLVVSNPPYVPERDAPGLPTEVRDHEPAVALYGGADGLEIYRRLIPDAKRLLRPSGWLITEIAHDGTAAVAQLLTGWREVTVLHDLAGLPRVIAAQRS
jgi:release factor glutamine methyltransferase